MRKPRTVRMCSHQKTRYKDVLLPVFKPPNKGYNHAPIGVQAPLLLAAAIPLAVAYAAYSKPSTRANETTTARIKPKMMKPSQGPCKKLDNCLGRTTPRRKAKMSNAIRTKMTNASSTVENA